MHFAALFTTAVAALAQFAAAAPTGTAAPVSYRNHKLVRFAVETAEQAELLSALARSEQVDVDAWTDIFPGAKADLRISPTAMSTLKTVFSRIKSEILSDDIQAGIDAERAESEAQAKAIQRASAGRSSFAPSLAAPLPAAQLFAAYQDHSTLVDFIGSLPGYSKISLGKTYEQRDITGFVIGNGARNNRQPNTGSRCIGTDPNRNFPTSGRQGASSNPCDDTYRGTGPASTKEAQAIINYIKATPNLWMFPWGYACNVDIPQPDLDDLTAASQKAVAALKAVNGVTFKSGPSCKTIYAAAGGSDDHTYSMGVKYSFSVELRDTGRNGFTLPASQIVPSGLETVAGVTALWKFIASKP
ncbi:hypothetical protein BC831DRAFT_507358 [Entophlyctis helioformis]|nr:hypothetical protein BC831DRAFT_507358 [Entophlyctis helioformis]